MQKTVLEMLRAWYFPYSAFWSAGQWGANAPPGYATAYSAFPDPLAGSEIVFTCFTFVFAMNLVGISAHQRSHWQLSNYVFRFKICLQSIFVPSAKQKLLYLFLTTR